MKKTILFVDDDPNILDGLRRMLHPMRKEWDMAFAQSGHEALELMAQKPFHVIVSDMRMPRMDGAALLSEVMRRYPQTVRFVLSGQSEGETIFHSVGTTHQFLAKPCDAETLKACVDRAFALRDVLSNESLETFISRITALPSLPKAYTRLTEELRSPDASISTVGKIIETDMAMTAKVLQLTNSAFFGVRRDVSSVTQAVSLLGLDTIKSLVLMVGVFSQASAARLPAGFSLDALWRHSMAVGACSQAISKTEDAGKEVISDACTAGLLHDSGMLVLAVNRPDAYGQILDIVRSKNLSLTKAEQAAFGCTHAQVGAYLLGIWGLPDSIVEAVAFHHYPSQCGARAFGPLAAVHAANALEHEAQGSDGGGATPTLDIEYLRQCGLEARIAVWRETCLSVSTDEEDES